MDSASECCTESRADSKQTYLGPTGELKQVKMTFGQGPVMGSITNDRVRLNELSTSNQSVVLINEHKVQGYCESSYDGVLGLGHRRYARESDQDTALLTTLGVESFSICFGRNNDEPGRLIIGGGLPRLSYFDIPVVGTRHWAVQMRGAAFGGIGLDASRVCDQPPHCGAIIDSGTSLLAGPRELVSQLLEGLGQAVAEDCSNVHELPNLTLRLGPEGGDQDFVLTPDVYITRTKELWQDALDAPAAFLSAADLGGGSLGGSLGGRMIRARSTPTPITAAAPRGRHARLPHARASMSLLAQSETVSDAPVNASDSGAAATPKEYCSVVFMELGMTDQDYGPVWILGVPFMRAYSAQFKRGGGEGTDLVQQPRPETNSTEASPEAGGAQPSVLVSEAERLDPSQPAGPAAQAAGQPAQTAAMRVTGNHSGLFIGFAAIPAGHNPCAGCDAELPPARVTGRLASMHTHALLAGSQGKRGGAAAPKRLPSVSLQHARLPSWAVLVKDPVPSVDPAPQRIRHFL